MACLARRAAAIIALLAALAAPAWAGFDAGVAAYERGDREAALRAWRPLAEQGHAEAQLRLGIMSAKGVGVAPDQEAAAQWFRKAAEQGVVVAQFNLAVMYAEGQGVPHDYALAHMWYNLAAARGGTTAAERRDAIAGKMPPAQIAEAHRLAREWMAAHRDK